MKFLRDQNVYEPAEDTFLLLDALEKDRESIIASKPAVLLEIGSGSGVVIAAVASILKFCHYIAVDVNPGACFVTKNTADMNETAVRSYFLKYFPSISIVFVPNLAELLENFFSRRLEKWAILTCFVQQVDIINTDLLKTFKLNGTIDVIIFNPPYVETEDEETLIAGISQSWAGGTKGRKVLDE